MRGTLKTIHAGGTNWTVDGGAGWSADVAPGTPIPAGKSAGDRLLRLDLSTGTVTPWFTDSGFALNEIGAAADGSVLVQAGSPQRLQLWLVSASRSAAKIYEGGGWNSATPGFQPAAVVDDHGWWLAGGSAVYLYTAAGGLKQIASSPFNANTVHVSGGCH